MERYIYNKELLPRPLLSGHDDWLALYDKAWELAFRNVDYTDKDGWKPQLTCMPGVGTIWQWDSCFMTLITNYANGTISALNNLDNLYRLRRTEDGFIGMAYEIADETESYPGRINPPLFAWAEWEHYLISGSTARFQEVLPAIEGLYGFIEKNRRRSCGLYWFEDPGSSGMDNSPRGGYASPALNGSDVCFIELACQQALTAECISRMYSVLGDAARAEFYRSEHNRICALINRYHWHEKSGFYYDFFARDRAEARVKLINTKTMAAAWTILCGAADDRKITRLSEHFFNPEEFYTKIPFASLSKDDLNYDPAGGYWLGSVWAPTDFVLIRGLSNAGLVNKAAEAAEKYLDGMAKTAARGLSTIWEAYAPEEYKPATTESGRPVRADFVGWSGLAPIVLLIENIIGLRFNAPENRVYFRIPPFSVSGIENMCFNGGRLSVVCEACTNGKGKNRIRVQTDKPFTLCVSAKFTEQPFVTRIMTGEQIIYI